MVKSEISSVLYGLKLWSGIWINQSIWFVNRIINNYAWRDYIVLTLHPSNIFFVIVFINFLQLTRNTFNQLLQQLTWAVAREMYHFDGNFRRQLQQNLSGQTATSKDTLILNAQNERHKRENARQRHHSSIVIQSYVRSFVSRKKIKRLEREKFDKHLKGTGLKDFNDLDFLLKRLLYFYDDIDGDRLVRLQLHHPFSLLLIFRLF